MNISEYLKEMGWEEDEEISNEDSGSFLDSVVDKDEVVYEENYFNNEDNTILN